MGDVFRLYIPGWPLCRAALALSAYSGFLAVLGVMICVTPAQALVNISGTAASYFDGTVYIPNAPVTYGGNSSTTAPAHGCYQVIAYAVSFSGNTTLDNSQCPNSSTSTGTGAEPNVQTVRLVQ